MTFNATTLVLGANITSSNGSLSVDVNAAVKLDTDVTITTNSGSFDVSGAISPNSTSVSGILQLKRSGAYVLNGSAATASNSARSLSGGGSLSWNESAYTWTKPNSLSAVSYTHLTLPTKRIV